MFEALKEPSSPYINRFLSADSIVPGVFSPQSLNRYSYVMNNPVRYIDPTGHKCVETGPGECLNEKGRPINGAGGLTPTKKKPDNNVGGGSGSGDYCATHIGSCGNPIFLPPQVMNTSTQGMNFIIYWENAGGPPDAYPYKDEGGTCTIGHGHVLPNGNDGCSAAVKKWYRDHPLSPSGARDFLEHDTETFENVIDASITVDLTQAQFDALVSYLYNSGGESNQPFFEKRIPELINSGNNEGVVDAIASGPITTGDPPVTLDILKERRQAEANLFLNGIYVP